MPELPFIKMHGLGNDFVVIDARENVFDVTSAQAQRIADRHFGVGCDQLIIIEPSRDPAADVFMRIRNGDGGEVSACGNATRCIAFFIMGEKNTESVVIETAAGLLKAFNAGSGLICVDMGLAKFGWRDIPLAESMDTLHLGVAAGPFVDPVSVSMGNPHAVFFVEDAVKAPLATFGGELERHKMFPEGVNVGVAQIVSPEEIRLRVWERGVGLTQACGSGACAALVAAHRRGLSERAAKLVLDGGALNIEWAKDDHVLMTGPAVMSFTGILSESLL